jgi:ATP-dependent RNA helicase DHX57
VYGSKVFTSKTFLRDCSVTNTIALFLFGGMIEMIHDGNTLMIDTLRFRAFPRISVLINGMRKLLDRLLETKISQPSFDILSTEIGQTIVAALST